MKTALKYTILGLLAVLVSLGISSEWGNTVSAKSEGSGMFYADIHIQSDCVGQMAIDDIAVGTAASRVAQGTTLMSLGCASGHFSSDTNTYNLNIGNSADDDIQAYATGLSAGPFEVRNKTGPGQDLSALNSDSLAENDSNISIPVTLGVQTSTQRQYIATDLPVTFTAL